MSNIIKGKIAVWNVNGTIAYGAVGSADLIQPSRSVSDQFERSEFSDQENIVGKLYRNRRLRARFTVIPFDSSATDEATARANAALPAMGADITIASADIGGTGAKWMDGTWNYEGGEWEENTGDAARWVFEAEKVGNTLPASLS